MAVVTITFDPSLLTAYYNSRTGVSSGSTASGSSSSTSKTIKGPTPPWGTSSTAAKASDLAKSLLQGSKLINTTAAKLDTKSTDITVNSDYKALFATYQGLTALEQLAEQASSTTIGASELAKLQSTFANGMAQLQSYLSSGPFKGFNISEGTVQASEKSTVVRPQETDTYQTAPIFTGSLTDTVPSFTGDVKFSATVAKASNVTQTVNFDLSEMGSTTRTLPNVINYMNGKLKAAGLTTRFANVRIPAQPQTITSGGKTYTTPAGADSFALQIKGTTSEGLTFNAPTSTPAVYVLQTSGTTTSTTSLTAKGLKTNPPDAVQQLVKLNADPTQAAGASDKVFTKTLATQTAAARATATGPDGSVYTISDVSGRSADGQAIQGAQDAVLTKYDSAGNVVYTRTLGAASSASSYALTVSPDGKKVAVAGSVTGKLDANDGTITAKQSDSYVSVYDATSGDESWTKRSGTAAGDDHPTGVAFAADGSVYMSGVTSARFNNQTQAGSQDGFIQSFSATGVLKGTQQFGAAGINSTSGIAVNGSKVFVTSTEDGHAVLRGFDIGSNGSLTASLNRDLGSLDGGNVAGVTVAADGSLIVAGSTHNGALNAGSATQAYSGGRDAFVAKLAADGQASGSDKLSYYNPGGDATATSVQIAGGKVYIAGQVSVPANGNTNGLPGHNGYVAAIDPTTGQASWSQQLTGIDGQDVPNSIAVSSTGASVLDALGLPTGKISYTPPNKLVDISSLRAGDSFSIQIGTGAAAKITIDANETLDTLASKIQLASGYNAKAKSVFSTNGYALQIAPNNDRSQITLVAGPAGQDALAPLGFTAGIISKSALSFTSNSKTNSVKASPYALKLAPGLNLNSTNDVKHAQAQLLAAQSTLKSIYKDLTTPPSTTSTKSSSASSGKVPTYITNQIANYQAGLTRLTGG
jgi:hypothetical protein